MERLRFRLRMGTGDGVVSCSIHLRGADMIHLTETGYNAGRTFCGSPRGNETAHGAYAPLHLDAFRARCCPACLSIWAHEAYETGDEMPAWVLETRANNKEVPHAARD